MNMPTKNNHDLRTWARTHAPLWNQDPASLGLSPQAALDFADAVADLEAAADEADTARQAALDATLKYNNALSRVKVLGSAGVNTIKAFAQATGDPTVFARSGVEPNARPGTLPLPVPPESISASVRGDGALILTWKARQPRGLENVHYRILRRDADGAWTNIGTAGSEKRFTDDNIPRGKTRLEYLIEPWRGGECGPSSNIFTFQIGTTREALTPASVRAAA